MFSGASVAVGKEIAECTTTDEIIKILQRENLSDIVLKNIASRIDFYMQHRVHAKIKTAALMFSNVYGILQTTKEAENLIKLHNCKVKRGG